MMLTIHGLPPNIKYHELKLIIKRECGINDFILGTLAADSDGTKKARIGIIDEQEGNVLTKYLDGYRLSGHVIRIVPIEKSTNEIHQSTFNNSGHQWRSNQQGQNFGKPLDTFNQNQIQVWSEQSNQPWVANQSVLPQQAPTLSNYEHVQPTPGVQQYFYQQQGSLPQNKIFVQQDKFPQARNVQQHGFGSSNKNLSSNFITPQRENNPRSIAFPNSDMGQHASGRPVQTGTFIKQSYGNSEKPPILKDPFQKSYDAGSQSGQPHQGQGYNQQWVPQNQQPKTEPFSKTSPSQFGKSSYNNKLIQPDKRKGILPHPEKDPEYQYDKGGRRFSPQRVERAPGIRSSPSGHRILPSGRRISPREMTPPRRTSPSYRRVSPNDRRNISPLGRRNSPPRRRISPNERRHSPDRGISSARRRLSPTGRRVSPHGRVISPVGRRVSPDRRSPNRRISPSSRVSPVRPVLQGNRHLGQRLSPKRMSPLKQSLGRKMSPGRRSPNRGHSPRAYARYSPSQTEKQMDTVRQGSQKDVRPAFVQISQAQNQPVYSGGYSPNSSSNYKYSSTSRQSDHRPLWRDGNKVYTPPKKLDDDVRDARDARDTPRIQKLDMPRQDYPKALLSHPETKVHSQRRMSRSPNPRDRSPVRDNYSRHSPSLTSPRRSWALEKRRNADYHDIPSPPLWPERQENAFAKHNQTHDGSKIRTSRWGKPYEAEPEEAVPRKEEYDNRDRENRKYNVSPNRSHWGPLQRSSLPFNDPTDRDSPPLQSRTGDRYTQKLKDSKFSPRDDYNAHHRKQFQGAHEREARFDRHDHKDAASKQELNDDYRSQINERKENLYVGDENLNRELEDVFKRVAKYTTKTNEYLTRKSEKRSYPSVDYRRMEQEDEEVYAFDKRNSRDDGPGPSSHGYYDESMSRYKRNLGIRNFDLNPNIQYKRDKAVDEITGKILIKFASDLKGKVRDDVEERLKFTVENMIFEMYGEKDVSFIEIVIKFADKYSLKDMEKIFDNVMSEFPTEIRRSKRYAPDDEPHVASKIARSSPTADLKKDVTHLPVQSNRLKGPMLNLRNEAPVRKFVPVKRVIPMNREEHVRKFGPVTRDGSVKTFDPVNRGMSVKTFVPTKRNFPFKKHGSVGGGVSVKSLASTGGGIVKRIAPSVNRELFKKIDPINKAVAVKKRVPVNEQTTKSIEVKTTDPAKNAVKTTVPVKEVCPPPGASNTAVKAGPATVVKEQSKEDRKDVPSTEDRLKLTPQKTGVIQSKVEKKVLQEARQAPTTEENKPIVDKMKNEAGDASKKLPGSNKSEKPAIVPDSLFVKIYFTKRPAAGSLTEFIKKYNLQTFKRVDQGADVFAAQLCNKNDFDRICNAKEIYCGEVKVTVKPCYKFSLQPQQKTTLSKNSEGQPPMKANCVEDNKEKPIKETSQHEKPKENQIEKTNQATRLPSTVETGTPKNTQIVKNIITDTKTKSEPKMGIPKLSTEKNETFESEDTAPNTSQRSKTSNVLESKITEDRSADVQMETKPKLNKKLGDLITSHDTVEEDDVTDSYDILSLISDGIVLDEC
ncbi:uncharacterized protein [Battus philenor]|uniref:uncharacterized protein isoform X2 n=1 Tax=Battus philenor TaxID=42288 RepID=UPI0035D0FC1B